MTKMRNAFKMLRYPRFRCFGPFWAQYSWFNHLLRPDYVIDGIEDYLAFNKTMKDDALASNAYADVFELITRLSMHDVELRREANFARSTIAHYRSVKACVDTSRGLVLLVVAAIALFIAVCGQG